MCLLVFLDNFFVFLFSFCFFCSCLNHLKVHPTYSELSPEDASCLRPLVTWKCILPTPTCHLKVHPT